MKSFTLEMRTDLDVREVNGELLVLDRRQERIHKFNHSAALIFECCDGRHTVDQIVDRVADTYGAPVDVARRDVAAAVREFSRLGLLASKAGVTEESKR